MKEEEELDKILHELNGNITRFKEMVDRYQQIEEQLNETSAGLDDLRRKLESMQDKPSPDREQAAQAGLDRLERVQQDLKGQLQRLDQDIQTVKNSKPSDEGQRQVQYQVLKDEVSRLGPRQGKIQEDIARLEQHRHDTQSLLQGLSDQMGKVVSAQQRWIYSLAALMGALLLVVVWLAVYSLSGNRTASVGKSTGDKPAKAEMPASNPAPPPDTLSQAPPPSNAGEQTPAGPVLPPESRVSGLMPAESAEKGIKDRSGFALTYLKHANFTRLAAK